MIRTHGPGHRLGLNCCIATAFRLIARESPYMSRHLRRTIPLLSALGLTLLAAHLPSAAANFPVTPDQQGTAQRVAEQGIPLTELAPDAPDSYTVKKGDTLWGISKLFLKSPWRWPELWGMNMAQIRNPHLIYPGQMLYLDKSNGHARLVMAKPVGGGDGVDANGRLQPRIRPQSLANSAIASVPMHLIGPFLNDAVVFDNDQLMGAPRIVATQEGRVLLSRGETAYVRGDVSAAHTWQLFREPKPLVDPATGELLGFEARNVGVAELVRQSSEAANPNSEVVPSTFTITQLREEANVGDRLAPLPPHDYEAFAPHPPANPMKGQVISVYGDGLNAGQNQIVSINRGANDGIERGHVLALWRAGISKVDATDDSRTMMRLPDERTGLLFVFRVFARASYALILQSTLPVGAGDTITQP